MKGYYNKLGDLTYSASEAAAGYPASNVDLDAVLRPWRSGDSPGGTVWVRATLAATGAASGVMVSEVNSDKVRFEVRHNPGGGAVNTQIEVDTYLDPALLRRRAYLDLVANGVSVDVERVDVQFLDTYAITDSALYWSVGAVHVFESSAALVDPSYNSNFESYVPQVARVLPNGQRFTTLLGPGMAAWSLNFNRVAEQREGFDAVISNGLNGSTIALALESRTDLAMPCKLASERYSYTPRDVGVDGLSVEVTEVC